MTIDHTTTDLAHLSSSDAIAVLREQIAPEAADGELAYFAQVCQRLELSPFADQICLIGRWDSRVKRKVHRHQITVAGRRTLASRTGNLRGIDGPVWSGPRDANGDLNWLEVWEDDADNPPYCARVLVYVEGWVKPANGTAKWSEFAVYDNSGNLSPMWRKMPSHMLGKVAESLALRRAFPDTINADVVGGYRARGVGDVADEWVDDWGAIDEAEAQNAVDTLRELGGDGVLLPEPSPTTSEGGGGSPAVGDDAELPPPDDDRSGGVVPLADRVAMWLIEITPTDEDPDDFRHRFLEAVTEGQITSAKDFPVDTIAPLRAALVRYRSGEITLRPGEAVFRTTTSPPTITPVVELFPDYEHMKVAELAALCRSRGLTPEGNKANLIDLLKAADQ